MYLINNLLKMNYTQENHITNLKKKHEEIERTTYDIKEYENENKEESVKDISLITSFLKKIYILEQNITLHLKGYSSRKSKIVKIDNDYIYIKNTIIEVGKIPQTILTCNIESKEISFNLKEFEIIHDNEIIKIKIPKEAKVTENRTAKRVSLKDNLHFNIGLFWPEKEEIIVGKAEDVSKIGLKITFNKKYFDTSFLTILKQKEIPIITIGFIIMDKQIYENVAIRHIDSAEENISIGCQFIENEPFLPTIIEYISKNSLNKERVITTKKIIANILNGKKLIL